MISETKVMSALKSPNRLSMWLGILVSSVILINAAFAAEARYTKQRDFLELNAFTRVSFAELHLMATQESINRIRAVPIASREAWQVEELLRLESVKEVQLRKLEGHK